MAERDRRFVSQSNRMAQKEAARSRNLVPEAHGPNAVKEIAIERVGALGPASPGVPGLRGPALTRSRNWL